MLCELFFLLCCVCVQGISSWQVSRCVQIAFPYSSSNTPHSLLEDVDRCLAKMYIIFPPEFRVEMSSQIEWCINNMIELEKSKPEYKKLQATITQITSNLGDSIVDAQHTVGQLSVCGEPLKHITNLKIFEESRFDTITKSFAENLNSADHCLEDSMEEVERQTSEVDKKISDYKVQYEKWLNMTNLRQDNAEKCKQDIGSLSQRVTEHIMSELNA